MDFRDEFNDFIVNELIDSSSLDDEDNFYFDATNIIPQALLNEPIHHHSIIRRRSVDHERLLWHYLLYHGYFLDNTIFDLELFRQRLVCSISLVMSHLYALL
jgi:hypothetical protein